MGVTAAVVGGVASAASAANGILKSGAQSSAGAQQSAAYNQATSDAAANNKKTEANFQPYLDLGKQGSAQLGGSIASLTTPFASTPGAELESLAQTPGYQFALQQGEQAAQNGFAAQGLGSSGAAIKGGVNYAEGLAGTTYQNQFTNYLAQQQQIYNQLQGITGVGENAAAGEGTLLNQGTGQAINATEGAGTAGAAGTIGSSNALASGISGIGNGVQSGYLFNQLQGNTPGAQTPAVQNGDVTTATPTGNVTYFTPS